MDWAAMSGFSWSWRARVRSQMSTPWFHIEPENGLWALSQLGLTRLGMWDSTCRQRLLVGLLFLKLGH